VEAVDYMLDDELLYPVAASIQGASGATGASRHT